MERHMTPRQATELLRQMGKIIAHSDPERFEVRKEPPGATILGSALIIGTGGHVFILPPKREKPH